jgi:hypothetical protein
VKGGTGSSDGHPRDGGEDAYRAIGRGLPCSSMAT